MALQNYREREVFPCGSLHANAAQFAELVMGSLGTCLTLDLKIGEKIILDDGLIIYRRGEQRYTLRGTSEVIVINEPFDEEVPSDLSNFLNRIINQRLGSVVLSF
jgi:hypothetical protein